MSEDLTSVDLGLVPRDVPNDKHVGTTFNRFSSEDLTVKWLVGSVPHPSSYLPLLPSFQVRPVYGRRGRTR